MSASTEPLPTVPPPNEWWCTIQALRGTNATSFTEVQIPKVDLTGKWIIVTGANNGIGYEASKVFAGWGGNLILACREPQPGEKHPADVVTECQSLADSMGHSSEIEWWKIELSDLASVESFAQRWLDTSRPLHVLCNNAGISNHPSREKVYTKDGFEFLHQVGTRYLMANNQY